MSDAASRLGVRERALGFAREATLPAAVLAAAASSLERPLVGFAAALLLAVAWRAGARRAARVLALGALAVRALGGLDAQLSWQPPESALDAGLAQVRARFQAQLDDVNRAARAVAQAARAEPRPGATRARGRVPSKR